MVRKEGMTVLEEDEAGGGGGGGGCGYSTPRDFFDGLPDDVVECILCKLSSSASSSSDFVSALMTCKRFKLLVMSPVILSAAPLKSVLGKASKWSESAFGFLQKCVDAGNVEASYALGMISFYCLKKIVDGAYLIAEAAKRPHAAALFSLSAILFNGSGFSVSDKKPRDGFLICYRAAVLGYVDAMLEVGFCFLDGYGVRQSVSHGRHFLSQANDLEHLISRSLPSRRRRTIPRSSPRIDRGYRIPPPEIHPVNRFLVEWFGARAAELAAEGLRLCRAGCGRPETRKEEFRRCSQCRAAIYCSRACQAMDWKLRHREECVARQQLVVYEMDGGLDWEDLQQMDADDDPNVQ